MSDSEPISDLIRDATHLLNTGRSKEAIAKLDEAKAAANTWLRDNEPISDRVWRCASCQKVWHKANTCPACGASTLEHIMPILSAPKA